MHKPDHWGVNSPAEELDDTPVEMPLGYVAPTPLEVLIARMVKDNIDAASNTQHESFEEADDFEPDEEDVLLDMTPYELTELNEDLPIPEAPTGDPDPAPAPPPPTPTGDPPDPDAVEPDQT